MMRRELVRQEIGMPVVYNNLKHFLATILSLKMMRWSKIEEEDSVFFEFLHPTYTLPELTLSVASELNFSVAVYNQLLPDDHSIYKDTMRSLKFIPPSPPLCPLWKKLKFARVLPRIT